LEFRAGEHVILKIFLTKGVIRIRYSRKT